MIPLNTDSVNMMQSKFAKGMFSWTASTGFAAYQPPEKPCDGGAQAAAAAQIGQKTSAIQPDTGVFLFR
jgi:hypothetical protein